MLLTLLRILLLLLDVKPDNRKADSHQAERANHHDDVEGRSWRNEQLQAPVGLVVGVHEDDELRVGDDRSPHMLSALSIDACSSIEGFHVVVGASDAKEGEWKLKTHVPGLVALRADCDQSIVFHVRDDESVRGTNRVIVVDVLRLLQLGVD